MPVLVGLDHLVDLLQLVVDRAERPQRVPRRHRDARLARHDRFAARHGRRAVRARADEEATLVRVAALGAVGAVQAEFDAGERSQFHVMPDAEACRLDLVDRGADGHVAGLLGARQAAAPAVDVRQEHAAAVRIAERGLVPRGQIAPAVETGPGDAVQVGVGRVADEAGRRFVAREVVPDPRTGHVAGERPVAAAQAAVDAPGIQRVHGDFRVVADVALEVRAGAGHGHAIDDVRVAQHAHRVVPARAAAHGAFEAGALRVVRVLRMEQ
ncbi:conserved hypothetical protein, partial [Ricinus communis]